MKHQMVMTDGNEATAYVAYRLNEVIAIYPITPSSAMGEYADQWMAERVPNLWGTIPSVVQMQSEGGAAGAVHGALQTGALSTTFTASQGLLLMIPNMYKIAGELTSTVFHISARSLAAQALSIFGDHQDVMACRQTGWAMLSSGSVQEAQDCALISTAATLRARVPFLHFFDGFRTSHEVNKIERISDEELRAMIDDELIIEHRKRALTPDAPVLRGTAQNPDVYFQGRETVNKYYEACVGIVEQEMEKFGKLTGRPYHIMEYYGAPDAERVIILMGSAAQTASETAELLAKKGEKVGVIYVRLYRPFSVKHLMAALPATVKKIAVLDRTKEAGALGEPLYQDVVNAVSVAMDEGIAPFQAKPLIIGGRYGLSSKDFTPAMAKGVFDELKKDHPKRQFTVGIVDDVTNLSIDYDPTFEVLGDDVIQAMFFGLGSDGTVGANKNSIKIIGDETENYAQGYFDYDSKKSGTVTVSHLRFGPRPIKAPYLISEGEATFVGCHQVSFVDRFDMLKYARKGSVFLLNSIYGPEEVWDTLPKQMQRDLIEKEIEFYVIDAYSVAEKTGMGQRINTIMQTCFFAISKILPRDEAIAAIKHSIEKTYGKRGEAVVNKNFAAVDQAIANMHRVKVPGKVTSTIERHSPVPANAPEYVKEVLGKIIDRNGESVKVSEMPVDGTFPTATTKWEKRNIALEIPVWEPDICIQCARCSFVCPHAAIRVKLYPTELLANAPAEFKSTASKAREWKDGYSWTVQVAPEDCTGCGLCVQNCPGKDKTDPNRKAINMRPQPPIREREIKNWDFFLSLPMLDRTTISTHLVKNSQLLEPLFEFSGACAGCGETPYIKLATQLFGDRMVIANATGCTSIYGGNLPTTPYAKNSDGRGPAWSNSLFEDNAEFGMGMRLTIDKLAQYARELLGKHAQLVGAELADAILNASQKTEAEIQEQRKRVRELKSILEGKTDQEMKNLLAVADYLVRKSVWIIGGDGWAYDIGYGGLDHVLASGRDVNVLVLDTEVYSNTGGQSSKATPRGAVAKFAADGRDKPKKDLGLISMSYGNIYVARVAMGGSDSQTLKAFTEADSYEGPSLIIAYSHCINHGIDMSKGLEQQKLAVASGAWPLYRYDPRLAAEGKNPLQLDSKAPSVKVSEYAYNETRYRMLLQSDEERAEMLMKAAQADAERRWSLYEQMAAMDYSFGNKPEEGAPQA
ncbi:MAG: pyruvate:ferredoxin (flavodoxin) oxidoreductase [Chloroflexi bacterium]|nr:pyruvate:ferredoxin (flavodoxin) oxidoreductase [Chloroflexota bacterium]HOE34807.1 pyruvate:ferredoxin (flavodoxin) oxidoreductase [Anaerolineaceae bacterium]HOT25292.1 pyruvate:ferredoxin (flavodoxin) oxidoreductase [Anaerolineaceae bacterium]HQK02858.1 pyruvate:ferredoxin (flavodoxin) oxidoreductase [Anaerolineaceae bacterium]HQL27398.1 pyruvate:ferredoxin (flavodoxin) oxidoreductase [Anaerolineaceae bacterium]